MTEKNSNRSRRCKESVGYDERKGKEERQMRSKRPPEREGEKRSMKRRKKRNGKGKDQRTDGCML